ncbi:hypothetical protein D1007_39802 [Hordeum vulgare]|uniref:Uncharacterized protein n=1 Tax=Hordeum vulgare subsp. vulgare TaxID=112509 RepID=A0A8I6W6C5_HORVV|nr:uncharacterized protein LOC123439387 isoform X1 [Hordeum vulgare subsp. vulgare]XP_044972051.1 uncharacterized protein LOC123439387 isoform X1 [Hordeum vulgare subsp. vulgare]XP_044972058.1 uncharacterized protein LOC123439387 isoform X1 [Hordeum vulgare subsp. vulgare]XP_044972064.1 uncharacterized protein LOC123439387 isoform X1 [Hordeum vulgare subsp. vulgare]XP_044972067.1 uncharacterized protein LOC123439387 isoform X1 [Hordeum vulgare subsp. vulgare]XP_044972074.1 uncharacterized prot
MGRSGFSRKRKERKAGSSRGHEPDDKGLRHRASPARIMKLYPHLTAGQREMIEGAGFGGLLRLQCPTVPARLSTWLLRRFDTETSELVIPGRGRIPVTVDSVHRVLGIPNRGRDVVYGLDDESIASVLDKHGVDSPPSMASLEKSIQLMKSADEHFLRTFIMLVLSSFLCPTSSLKVSPRCFPALVNIGSIKELNWCKFVVEQLEKGVSSLGKKNSAGGCLFYLVILYLDSLDVRGMEIPDGTPRVSAWDRKLMDKVIEMDMKNNGSFGKCFLKKEAPRQINSRGASSSSASVSVLLGDVSAIANFVSSNVLPEYCPQKKEVLCKAAGTLCASITDALAKFMREVSGLEGCSREASKNSTELAVREDNNVDNDCDNMDVDLLPDDTSELATKDMEDTSVDEHEDESSGDGEEDVSISRDSEDDPDWGGNRVMQIYSQRKRVTRNSSNSKEPGDGKDKPRDVTTNCSGNDDSNIPDGNKDRVNQCSEEHENVAKPRSPNVHEDVMLPTLAVSQTTGEPGDVTTNVPGKNASDILEGDQGRVNRCSEEEHVNVAKLTPSSGDVDMVVPISAVSLPSTPSMQQKNTRKECSDEDKMTIQPSSMLLGASSTMALYDNGTPSKEDKNMDMTPAINFVEGTPLVDLSTPENSDSECTVIRTVKKRSPVDGPQRPS